MESQATLERQYGWLNPIFNCGALTPEEQILLYCGLGGSQAFATLVLCDLGYCDPRKKNDFCC
jgi:3-mercaptopyruvate sulfurtransferase SseA